MGCGGSKDGANDNSPIDVDVAGTVGGSFSEQYVLGKPLGKGTFSVVRLGTHRATKKKYAIKCIKKEGLSEEDNIALAEEVRILKEIRHPNIMRLEEFFSEDNMYYLVTELLDGGELFDRIVVKSFYSEEDARELVAILLGAIKYCHDNQIVHRDLKPENLLMVSADNDSEIKVADFGFAKHVGVTLENLETACGTPGYVAPEILEQKGYGKPVDMWSIGVITYILLGGYPPFHDDNQATLFRKIKSGRFHFQPEYWDPVSTDAKDLIAKLLVVDPNKRLTADQALHHPWLKSTVDFSQTDLSRTQDELRKMQARRRFRAGAKAVIATNKMANMIGGLKSAANEIEQAESK